MTIIDKNKIILSMQRNASDALFACSLLLYDDVVSVDVPLKSLAKAIDDLYDNYKVLLECYKQKSKD